MEPALIYTRPTVEARAALYTAAQRKAEEIRIQIRKQHQVSLKRGKYGKHSIELEEVCAFVFH
jgi:ribosome recycling factor